MATILYSQLVGIALLLAGIVLTLFCLIRLFVGELRDARERSSQSSEALNPTSNMVRRDFVVTGLVVVVLVAGLLLRLDGLGSRSMSHPELFVPGIDLPEDISAPPPLLSLPQAMWWHFHTEVHPQGYYFFMWGWTRLFGTSLSALRLPSVIFGTLSLVLVFCLASQVFDRWTGLIGMALLAFNGHHIYWSQMARMYSMLCFFGLLSTLLLVKLFSSEKRRPVLEAMYVAVSFLGFWTEVYFWPFLAAQILWALACIREGGSKMSRIISLQALAVILGAPLWAQAIYASRASPPILQSPSLIFLEEYLSFGFLFERDFFSLPVRQLPEALTLSLALFAVILIARALRDGEGLSLRHSAQEPLSARKLLPIASGAVVVISAMSILALSRRYLMMLSICIPMIALGVPSTISRVNSLPGLASLKRFSLRMGPRALIFFLALIPAALVLAISFIFPLLGSRLFLLFTPFLLIVIAEGIRKYSRRLAVAIPLLALLLVMHGYSVAYYKLTPSDSRAYKDLAQEMMASVEEGDLIFVPRRSWVTTPLFYHLSKGEYRYIAQNYHAAVDKNPNSRVWLVLFGEQQPNEQMRAALTGFTIERTIGARRGRAVLFVRNGLSRNDRLLGQVEE